MTASAYDQIRRAALDGIEQQGLDPGVDVDAVAALVESAVAAYQRSAQLGGDHALRDPDEMAARVLASVAAYGPLTDLLERADVEEIFIEGPRVTFLDRAGRLVGLEHPSTTEENRAVVDRLLAGTGRTLDARNPLVQARVLNGAARLTAAIPPVAEELSATLRRHATRSATLDGLVVAGSLTPEAAALLAAAMASGSSVLVSGQPGAGKTSLLSALLGAIPAGHCVRVCEEIRELNQPLAHGSYYEARPGGLDGGAEIDLRALLRHCLAMRPDVLVVGEVRGAEAFELTRAANAGCGFACTVHANSAREALDALTNAAVMAGERIGEAVLRRLFAAALDLVVHLDVIPTAEGLQRSVREIVTVLPSLGEGFSTEPVFSREAAGAPLRWTGALPRRAARMAAAVGGGDLGAVLGQVVPA